MAATMTLHPMPSKVTSSSPGKLGLIQVNKFLNELSSISVGWHSFDPSPDMHYLECPDIEWHIPITVLPEINQSKDSSFGLRYQGESLICVPSVSAAFRGIQSDICLLWLGTQSAMSLYPRSNSTSILFVNWEYNTRLLERPSSKAGSSTEYFLSW